MSASCDPFQSGMRARIPKIIHLSWIRRELPPELVPLADGWRSLTSRGWTVQVWTDEQNEQLWQHYMPNMLDVYHSYNQTPIAGVTRQAGIRRADATRLLYMHIFGGVYADLDSAPCGEFDDALQREQLILVREPGKGKSGRRRYISNFFMASAPGHPFWRHALHMLRLRAQRPDVMSASGPYFLNAAWNSWSQECAGHVGAITILPYSELQARFAVHFWAGSWHVRKHAASRPPVGNSSRSGSHHNSSSSHSSSSFVFDRGVLAWRGINHSNNCPGAALPQAFVDSSWRCYHHLYPCPRLTWKAFLGECGGVKAGCPERQGAKSRWQKDRSASAHR